MGALGRNGLKRQAYTNISPSSKYCQSKLKHNKAKTVTPLEKHNVNWKGRLLRFREFKWEFAKIVLSLYEVFMRFWVILRVLSITNISNI